MQDAPLTSAFTEQDYHAYPEGIERQFWHIARHAILCRWLRRHGMDRMRLLEIGCGRGIVVDHLRSQGIDCTGCDLADAPVPPRLSSCVFPATDFRRLDSTIRAGIEGVLLCDVIEHIADAPAFLGSIPQALPAARMVLITVPARRELWSEWDDRYRHQRRYDLALLRREVEMAGLQLVAIRYVFHSLYLPMLMARGLRSGEIKAPTRRWLHWAIGRAMTWEQVLVPGRVPGSSIFAVASMPAHHRG